ncbi:DUF397 domain-containing protein [Streptomyces sp. NPDC090021]|uniref:DUF397 domain-containing protein n=1 Tax=Streptomyces sp. NPDC090021 TaxID=3365919 RepID=UPI003802C7AE
MSELSWFKSSYSEASGNACVEIAICEGDGVAIRDSVFPSRVITTTRAALAALVVNAQTSLSVTPR